MSKPIKTTKSRLTRRRTTKTSAQLARIAALEQRIADMEVRLARLERPAIEWPSPAVPPGTTPWFDSDPRCQVCHSRYADLTHYVCNHMSCPNRVTITCKDYYEGVPPQPTTLPGWIATCGGDTKS